MSPQRLAFALRPGVFSPQEIIQVAQPLDATEEIESIFVPDGRTGYESLEIVSSILSATKRIRAGSGVIRLLEHDPQLLLRRIQTLQAVSSNRFNLGVGTGTPGPSPSNSISATLEKLEELKKGFRSFPNGIEPPKTYVATLKPRIAQRAANRADGILMNFCTPQHASKIIDAARTHYTSDLEFACYLKLFFSSKDDVTARRLLVQEFLNYDSTPQYHEMFIQDGTADSISKFRRTNHWKHGRLEVPNVMLETSIANPSDDELSQYVQSFRRADVTLPVAYPYFPTDENSDFKRKTLERIIDAA